ncbi:MAG TPA: 16S rRNA (guanine(527)-N(7))-methyltransferase RsmG [Tepidisphaeraceae bacterium]|jgi:16S rRNA (guanine527-N7)-methyltransferase
MNELWNELAASGGVTLSPQQHDLLNRYLDGLIEKNQVMNLTRITDRPGAEIKHVADALTLLPHLPAAAGRRSLLQVADVGTGGGIPGVILAIARPDTIVTLIDATKKKLDAVQGICEAIGVKNVRTVHSRAADVGLTFDVVVARAVGELQTLVDWCHGLLRPKSAMLAMKGPRAVEELEAAGRLIRKLRMTAEIIDVARPELPGHVIVKLKAR